MSSYTEKFSAVLSFSLLITSFCYGQGNGNPRLNLTISPSEREVSAGGSAAFDVEVKGVGNFNGTVTFTTNTLPAGLVVAFSPSTLTLKNGQTSRAAASVTVAANVAPGRYPINFIVNGGSVSDSATAVLSVSANVPGSGFEFNVSPMERTVARGDQTDFNLSLSMSGVGQTTVKLSLSSAPNGISAVFAPTSTVVLAGGQISIVTAVVKVDGTVQPGDYQLLFAADSSTTHRERTVLIHVPGIDAGTFEFDVSPGFRTLLPSTTLPFTLTLGSRNGFQGMVNLSASGLPPGATVSFQPGGSIALTPGSTAVITALIRTGPAVLAGNFPVRFSADSVSIHRERVVILGLIAASDLELEVVPTTQSVASGSVAKFALLLNPSSSFSGPVKLGVRQLPAGAVAVFDPSDTIQLSSGKASAVTLLVNTAPGTPLGDYPLILTADTGSTSQQKTVTLRVVALESFALSVTPLTRTVPPGGAASYELTLTSVGQFSGAIAVSTGSLPPGVTAYFTPDNNAILPAGGTVKLIATLVADAVTPAGSYLVEFEAKSGGIERKAMVRFGVEGGSWFNFTAAPLLRIAQPGSSTSFPLTLTSLNSFAGPVNITSGVLPTGVTLVLSPLSPIVLQTGQSIGIAAQVSIAPGVPEGKYPIRFTASSANASSDVLVMLWVTTEQGFYLDATPDWRDVAPGNTANYTLRLTSIGSFKGAVQLSAQGLPAGSSAVFQPGTSIDLTPGQTQIVAVTVITTAATPLGPATLKFNADMVGLHKEDSVTLNVIATSGFRMELAPSLRMVAPGASGTFLLTLWSMGGFAGAVDLSVTGLPDGFTAALDPGSPVQLEAGGVEVVQIVVQVPADASSGLYRFEVHGLADGEEASVSARIWVNTDDTVTLRITPAEQSVTRGQTATFAVRVTSDDYEGPVMLSTAGLPPGATAFTPASHLIIHRGETVDVALVITPGVGTSVGTYRFVVLADTSASRSAEAYAKLNVVDGQNSADFSMLIMPESRTVNSGATAVYKVLLTSLNGFRGSIDLSVLGYPAGNVKWESDDSVYLEEGATRSATLLIKTEKGAEERSYRLLFAADSDNLHREATGSMTVVKTPAPDDDNEE